MRTIPILCVNPGGGAKICNENLPQSWGISHLFPCSSPPLPRGGAGVWGILFANFISTNSNTHCIKVQQLYIILALVCTILASGKPFSPVTAYSNGKLWNAAS